MISVPVLAVMFGPRRGITRSLDRRLLVGRGPETDLQLIDEKVSREHCVFERVGETVVLKDLGSRNGTWVNGERLTSAHTLVAGDQVGIGETVVAFAPDFEALRAVDGESTLILSNAAPTHTIEAGTASDDDCAQAGRLLLRASLCTDRGEAAGGLAEAFVRALKAEQVLVCIRSPEGALLPWVAVPQGANVCGSKPLAELCFRSLKAVAANEPQSRPSSDEHTTRVLRARAHVLAAPLMMAGAPFGVVFATRTREFDSQELALATVLVTAAAPALRPVQVAAPVDPEAPIAESASMREAVRIAKAAARSLSTVLVTGESGTGKEVIARLIHRSSARAKGPLVAVNCGALAAQLVESELFGHEKGAFTGALQSHAGVFERADGGTLFLDELGELPLGQQVKLLRVLEDRLVQRVGGRSPVPVDVRVVCATNKALEAEVAAGRFSEALYWRINVVKIVLPPLRERREDIVPLAKRLLRRHAQDEAAELSPELCAALTRCDWPGNVRQLSNALERAWVLRRADGLTLADLPPEVVAPKAAAASGSTLGELISAVEREQIQLALRRTRGVKAQAAEQLGISRPTLDRKIQEYGIDWLEPAEAHEN
jgi:DNA-binding NtrC family response regulator/pSer/pThr/pTyr-binding forkhead associated (FHA) protein